MGMPSHEHSGPSTSCTSTRSRQHAMVRVVAVVSVYVCCLIFSAETLIQTTSLFQTSDANTEGEALTLSASERVSHVTDDHSRRTRRTHASPAPLLSKAELSRSGDDGRQNDVRVAQHKSKEVMKELRGGKALLLLHKTRPRDVNVSSVVAETRPGGQNVTHVRSHGRTVAVPWNCKVEAKRLFCKPDVLLIGASKCGTTSLAHWLAHHPAFVGVGSPDNSRRIRETNLFVDPEEGMGSYWRDVTWFFKAHGRVPRVVEYTPNTMYAADAIPIAQRVYGNDIHKLKLLVLLREPTSRVVSSYKMKVHANEEDRAFPVVVKEGLETMDNFETRVAKYEKKGTSYIRIWTRLARIREDFEHGRAYALHHVIKSAYVYQLRAWLSVFSRSQFHILEMEDMYRDPSTAFQSICDFLDEPMLATADGKVGYKDEAALTHVLHTHKLDSSHYEDLPLFKTIPFSKDAEEMRVLRERFVPLQKALMELIGSVDYPIVGGVPRKEADHNVVL